ncbi:MAG: bacillithiol biosynthesis deacetylase BshB1 [Candidatus Hydrogenedens sp.]|nr:bacillithiol biosynthesis deacetylase BshB1 [Candidatus Hydrogenedens sp.]
MNENFPTADILAIGAHPDDVELGIGGLIARLSAEGKRVAILDLTRGEMSSRGTPEERQLEAEEAAKILGLTARVNAGLPDGVLSNTPEQRKVIIPYIRQFRPKVVLTLMTPDRHPDHAATYHLAKEACFLSGLRRIETGHEPYRPETLFFFHPYLDMAPEPFAIMDISDYFSVKLESIAAHRSQFHNPDYKGASTYISSPEFWESIEHRARFWGRRIGVTYGEPLHADGPVALDSLPGL